MNTSTKDEVYYYINSIYVFPSLNELKKGNKMKRFMTTAILVASMSMAAGVALANGQNDTTDIRTFGAATSQNGQNDRVQSGSQDLGDYPTLHTYTGGKH